MRGVPVVAAITVTLLVAAPLVRAQPAPGEPSAPGIAGQGCLQHLAAFGRAMNQDGYWLNGWHPDRTALPAARAWPRGDADWPASPDGKLRALYSAADVLAGLGDEGTCEAVLARARALYATSVAALRERGVPTGKVRDHRREQIGSAVAVARLAGPYRLSGLTGTEVRTDGDEYLGAVEDVFVDPRTGRPGYVLIGTGGFLGIGEEYVAVPWAQLRATPDLGMLILGVTPDVLDKAPKVDPKRFVGVVAVQEQEEVDAYWKTLPGPAR